jgi:AbrB family looped-hinge helix DNA binding protein
MEINKKTRQIRIKKSVVKIGNSYYIVIPKILREFLGIQKGTKATIEYNLNDKIILDFKNK